MAEDAPQLLSYETPTRQPAPACIRLISIAGIFLGLAMLLYQLLALLMAARWTQNHDGHWLSHAHQIYGPASALIFAAFALTLIVTSIGCAAPKAWARVWLVRYACCYLIALALDTIALLWTFLPLTTD